MDIKNIAVIGVGTMGNGIAHTFAQFGYNVLIIDVNKELLDKGIATITKNLDRQVKKEKISEEQKKSTLSNIKSSLELTDVKESELIIEAATENINTKKKIFETIDKAAKSDAIIASNTSSISITEIAAFTKRPDKVIGMHFMNPVPMMKLIEVIRGLVTSQETFDTIYDLSKKIEKEPVEVQDFPGFVSNRVLIPMLNEAMYCVMEGVATPEAIDTVMKLGMAHPMGPLQLADFIGLDVCLSILNVMYDGFKNPKYAPCPLLVNMVRAGKLGIKSGEGFYDYSESRKAEKVAKQFS